MNVIVLLFKVPADATKWKKSKVAQSLLQNQSAGDDVVTEYRFYVHLPDINDHRNHCKGEVCQKLDIIIHREHSVFSLHLI